jgi:OmpA-OmpF porin, OOP family
VLYARLAERVSGVKAQSARQCRHRRAAADVQAAFGARCRVSGVDCVYRVAVSRRTRERITLGATVAKALFHSRKPLGGPGRIGRGGFRLAVVAAALSSSAYASASDFSAGIGVGADRGRVDCVASMPCDHSSAAWKVFGGYRINDAFDLQAAYFDAGSFHGGDTTPLGTEFGGTFKVSGFSITGGYTWRFAPSWDLAGRAGLASVRTRFDYADAVFGSVSKTTAQPVAGIGVGYALTPAVRLGVDYDITRFKVHTTHGSLQTLGFSARYAF